MARVAGTLEAMELPRSPAQGSPASQGCSPAHTGAPPGSSVGGVRPLPARPLLRDSCPVSKGLFAERPPGRKGQHPEPQPASCHQGIIISPLLIINPGTSRGWKEKHRANLRTSLASQSSLSPDCQWSPGACGPPIGHCQGGEGTGVREAGVSCLLFASLFPPTSQNSSGISFPGEMTALHPGTEVVPL